MIGDLVGSFVIDEPAMLADLAQLTPEPIGLTSLLLGMGYKPDHYTNCIYAPGDDHYSGPTILFRLHVKAGLSVRKRQLIGSQVSRSATIAAGLTAFRSIDRRPSLLFMSEPGYLPAELVDAEIVSLEGGVVPRIWRNCFGRLDILVRVTGQRSHSGSPNTAVNAIEHSLPLLQALLHLKADIQLRSTRRGDFSDAPLQPRLTISAAHGGSGGATLPTVFDLLLSRRYLPSENPDAVLAELKATIANSAPRMVRVEVDTTQHVKPVADPDTAQRGREQRALAQGWGWPQVAFCTSSTLIPGSIVLGGLERPDCDPDDEDARTTLDDMAALARTLRALILA